MKYIIEFIYSNRIKIISSLIFFILFVLICVMFEFVYRGSITNQINKLIHEILMFGL